MGGLLLIKPSRKEFPVERNSQSNQTKSPVEAKRTAKSNPKKCPVEAKEKPRQSQAKDKA
jgi:hypothetical protein